MVSDGYVKYEEAEVHRSAIMQNLRNNKKKKNGQLSVILDFICAKFVMVILVRDITFCFILMVQLFCIFFELREYDKIIKIQNGH